MSVFLGSQYVVIPTRRSTAEAVQILMSHLLGDAGSPYLIGVVMSTLFGSVNITSNLYTPEGTFSHSDLERKILVG